MAQTAKNRNDHVTPSGMTNPILADIGDHPDPMNKHSRLLALAERRQTASSPGYTSIGDYHDGFYECDFVSPYTRPPAT
jgi:hypothetical protein